jgi:EAL domain-containing protein (putative c-di-GMP-specific phosphodiesterase class I)
MAINISPILFADKRFVRDARQIIDAHGIPPHMIEFEITESLHVHDIDQVSKTARELMDDGFGIGIDDFGTGFSSLKYLDTIPASTLKIDRHFIEGIGKRAKCNLIAETVARLAIDAGMIAVAEGIETNEQLDAVINMGYDELQGFLLAKPMSLSGLEVFLKGFNQDCRPPSNAALLHSHFQEGCL